MPKSDFLPKYLIRASTLSSCLVMISAVLISSCGLAEVKTDPPSTTPEETSTSSPIPPSPTQIAITPSPTTIPSVTPVPSATLINTLFDDFNDACISINKWYPQSFGNNLPYPTPIIRGNCFDFSYPDIIRHLVETKTHLVLNLTNDGKGGIVSYWPSCQVREVQLVISDYSFRGISDSWLGLIVPHPEAGQKPLSIWISSRESFGESFIKIVHTRQGTGDQTAQTINVLSDFVPKDIPIILGIRFTGEDVIISAGNVPGSRVVKIPAKMFPHYFVISYKVEPGSELLFKIDEVRVIPRAYTSDCDLPTVTPSP